MFLAGTTVSCDIGGETNQNTLQRAKYLKDQLEKDKIDLITYMFC